MGRAKGIVETPDNFSSILGTRRGLSKRDKDEQLAEKLALLRQADSLTVLLDVLSSANNLHNPTIKKIVAAKIADDAVGVIKGVSGDWGETTLNIAITCGVSLQHQHSSKTWDNGRYPKGITLNELSKRIEARLDTLQSSQEARHIADETIREYLVEAISRQQLKSTKWLQYALGKIERERLGIIANGLGGISGLAKHLSYDDLHALNTRLIMTTMGIGGIKPINPINRHSNYLSLTNFMAISYSRALVEMLEAQAAKMKNP